MNKRTDESARHAPTKDEVISRLEEAHVALLAAAETIARYGASEQAAQMAGAATMVSEDWIPAIRAEEVP